MYMSIRIIFYLNLLLICSLTMFLTCYFPTKKQVYVHNDSISSTNFSSARLPRLYDKIILMVIDALRVDFVLEATSPMKFTRWLLDRNGSYAFVGKVHPPTVTLPRIKALTTGSIPGFVDVILNFGSSSLQEDNIIDQMRSNNHTVTFYGDDTWLKLFPDHFTRKDGTSSFFVTDYTEVDDNVTRHLDKELEEGNFDVMILHYLGLDHIGHMAGPSSPLVVPKLQEMDRIIQKIFQGLKQLDDGKANLLVICGDHGMSDQGGHGGASHSETHVPILFFSTQMDAGGKQKDIGIPYTEVDQVDMCPTLSTVFGLPIPRNNMGKIILEVLHNSSLEQKADALLLNSQQMLALFQHNIPNFDDDNGGPEFYLYQKARKLHSKWLNHLHSNLSTLALNHLGEKVILQYIDCMVAMSTRISSSLTQYDMYALIVFILLIWMIFLTLLLSFIKKHTMSTSSPHLIYVICTLIGCLFIHVTVCTNQSLFSPLVCDTRLPSNVMIQTIVLLNLSFMIPFNVQLVFSGSCLLSDRQDRYPVLGMFLLFGTILHSLSLLSSSFVEEEHQTWYFFSITIHIIILVKVLKTGIIKTCASPVKNTSQYTSIKDNECQPAAEVQFTTLKRKVCESSYKGNVISAQISSLKNDVNLVNNMPSFNTGIFGTKQPLIATLTVLFLCRVMRIMNQTGNKWLHLPDAGDWLVRPENKAILSSLIILSMMVIILLRSKVLPWKQKLVFSLAAFGVYLYRSALGMVFFFENITSSQGIWEARWTFLMVLLFLVMESYRVLSCHSQTNSVHQKDFSVKGQRSADRLHGFNTGQMIDLVNGFQSGWLLLMLILMKPHNIILVTMLTIKEHVIWNYLRPWILPLHASYKSLYFMFMGQAMFFYQGNSNSLSTVDIGAGYIGLEEYRPVIIGILMTLATYCGVIFWLLTAVKFIIGGKGREKLETYWEPLKEMIHTIMLTLSWVLSLYTVLTVVQRYHLFVWTVFSPKLLYEGMRTLVLSVISVFITLLFNCVLR